ncbi:metallophosphoesterase [Candidatus Micrarchaeota archaeon]|nr:metallophosphoesterase [Candidatus Micrarchaeota archaeon]MBU1939942.1 metallophosphoesterase [Candidatus Micrarchaeota archaeon]
MHAVFIADVHADIAAVGRLAEWLIHNNKKPDVIAIAGDLTQEGSEKVAGEVIDLLEKTGARVLAVPGNMDSGGIIEMLGKRGAGIHLARAEVAGFAFAGLGGAKPANTYYRINMGELEAKKRLDAMLKGCNPKRTVIVSHCPPYGTALSKTGAGIDLGLRALRDAIEKFMPLMCVCGHVHEAKGSEMLGETLCINTGPLKHGSAAAVELMPGKKPKVEWIELGE